MKYFCDAFRILPVQSNFLHEFSTLSPHKTKKSRSSCQVDALWLALLVNLSFSIEGQSMILKVEGIEIKFL
jgi:rotatin